VPSQRRRQQRSRRRQDAAGKYGGKASPVAATLLGYAIDSLNVFAPSIKAQFGQPSPTAAIA
jgi:hypothetical protein